MSVTKASLAITRKLQDSILEFPTKNQPVMNTVLKDMLASLRSTIHADIISLAHQFKSEVAEVSQSVTHIENKMEEFASTFNEMVVSHKERDENMHWVKSKQQIWNIGPGAIM